MHIEKCLGMRLPDYTSTVFLILHLYSQRCVSITTFACAAVFLQSYYISVDGRGENEIIATVREISDQLDFICRNTLVTYACHYLHPPCDPDTGIVI